LQLDYLKKGIFTGFAVIASVDLKLSSQRRIAVSSTATS